MEANLAKISHNSADLLDLWATCQIQSLLCNDNTIGQYSPSTLSIPGDNSLRNGSDKASTSTIELQSQATSDNGLTNVARKLQSTAIGLLARPVEIRQLIYFYIFRPDCRITDGRCEFASKYKHHTCKDDFSGCASFLAICSHVYIEAKGFVDSGEPFISIRGDEW